MALRPAALTGSGLPEGCRVFVAPGADDAEQPARAAPPKKKRKPSKPKPAPAPAAPAAAAPPSGSALYARVREIVSAGDASSLTKRGVRELLATDFGAAFVKQEKKSINRMICLLYTSPSPRDRG